MKILKHFVIKIHIKTKLLKQKEKTDSCQQPITAINSLFLLPYVGGIVSLHRSYMVNYSNIF